MSVLLVQVLFLNDLFIDFLSVLGSSSSCKINGSRQDSAYQFIESEIPSKRFAIESLNRTRPGINEKPVTYLLYLPMFQIYTPGGGVAYVSARLR